MLGLILALPLACVPAVPQAAADPIKPTREVGAVFVTLQVDEAIQEGPPLPMLGARLTGVLDHRFGLEASVAKVSPFATLAELSAVAVIKLLGDPVLLRAGVSHVPGYGNSEVGLHDAATGFHVGAALLTGDVDDRVRMRLDYTYRRLGPWERGVSSVGLGLVLGLD